MAQHLVCWDKLVTLMSVPSKFCSVSPFSLGPYIVLRFYLPFGRIGVLGCCFVHDQEYFMRRESTVLFMTSCPVYFICDTPNIPVIKQFSCTNKLFPVLYCGFTFLNFLPPLKKPLGSCSGVFGVKESIFISDWASASPCVQQFMLLGHFLPF